MHVVRCPGPPTPDGRRENSLKNKKRGRPSRGDTPNSTSKRSHKNGDHPGTTSPAGDSGDNQPVCPVIHGDHQDGLQDDDARPVYTRLRRKSESLGLVRGGRLSRHPLGGRGPPSPTAPAPMAPEPLLLAPTAHSNTPHSGEIYDPMDGDTVVAKSTTHMSEADVETISATSRLQGDSQKLSTTGN
jgi:hypothetical protein